MDGLNIRQHIGGPAVPLRPDPDRDPASARDFGEAVLVGDIVTDEDPARPANGGSAEKAAIATPLSLPAG
jgi:hypothetical protein